MATQVEIAKHLDLTERRVRELLRDGVLPPSKGRGGFDTGACRLAYIRYLRGLGNQQIARPSSEQGEESIDLDLERARNLREDTALKVLRRKQLERELAPIEIIRWTLSSVGAQIATLFDGIPLKIHRRVPRLSAAEIDLIRKEIVKAQNMAAKVTPNFDEFDRDNAGADLQGSSARAALS